MHSSGYDRFGAYRNVAFTSSQQQELSVSWLMLIAQITTQPDLLLEAGPFGNDSEGRFRGGFGLGFAFYSPSKVKAYRALFNLKGILEEEGYAPDAACVRNLMRLCQTAQPTP